MKIPFCLMLVGLIASSVALALPTPEHVPGGVALVNVSAPEGVRYKGRPVMVQKTDTGYVAVVGIPLSAKPGRHSLTTPDGNIAFSVVEKAYREQRLTITNKRKVNPYAEDMDRIRRERKEMDAAFSVFSETKSDFEFIVPTEGIMSSSFGLRRILNDQPRNPHSGMDIAAPEGTPIYSPADGEVVAAGDYFFNGNTVIVDHGKGLITLYCHMNTIDVSVGDRLNKGEQLGSVGKTGRVTGAHLHWSVSLNNARVNPALFLQQEDSGVSQENLEEKPL